MVTAMDFGEVTGRATPGAVEHLSILGDIVTTYSAPGGSGTAGPEATLEHKHLLQLCGSGGAGIFALR